MPLTEIAFGKFSLHLPLHRQSVPFAREDVEIDVSTMADWMAAVSVALKPMVEIIAATVQAAQRLRDRRPREGSDRRRGIDVISRHRALLTARRQPNSKPRGIN